MTAKEMNEMLLARYLFRWAESQGINIESVTTKPKISAVGNQDPAVHRWEFSWKSGGRRHLLQVKSLIEGAKEVAEITGCRDPEEWAREDMGKLGAYD